MVHRKVVLGFIEIFLEKVRANDVHTASGHS
jgi:hypothetical protein